MNVNEITFNNEFRSPAWRKMGACIFDFTEGSDEGYKYFVKCSMSDPNIDDANYFCNAYWELWTYIFRRDGLKIETDD